MTDKQPEEKKKDAQRKKRDPKKKEEDDLSEEDKELKEKVDLMVQRLMDNNEALAEQAL